MMYAAKTRVSRSRDAVLAKLVICIGAVVALATSAPPSWVLEHEQSASVALDDSSTRKLLLTIELGGALYADTRGSEAELTITTDRAASDLTVVIERLGGGEDPSTSSNDAGAESGQDEGPWLVNFTLEAPARASQWLRLACPPSDLEPREETCLDQFEITLARESESPLQAQLLVRTNVFGQQEKRPRGGTFAVSLEEVAP